MRGHRRQVRFIADERMHRAACSPSGARPEHVIRVGENICAKVAVGVFRLLRHGDSSGEELVEQRRITQPEPGHDDNGHHASSEAG
jgi:hypothetical protein